MSNNYFVYITTNSTKSTFYTGMTNNLEQRIIEHYLNRGQRKTFAGRYYCYYLLYYDRFQSPSMAIEREKEIKDWNRSLKERLINEFNPSCKFLNSEIMQWPPDSGILSRT
ncbi:MAG: GIY-YIG nuclease family protein [Ekhidna sp.]